MLQRITPPPRQFAAESQDQDQGLSSIGEISPLRPGRKSSTSRFQGARSKIHCPSPSPACAIPPPIHPKHHEASHLPLFFLSLSSPLSLLISCPLRRLCSIIQQFLDSPTRRKHGHHRQPPQPPQPKLPKPRLLRPRRPMVPHVQGRLPPLGPGRPIRRPGGAAPHTRRPRASSPGPRPAGEPGPPNGPRAGLRTRPRRPAAQQIRIRRRGIRRQPRRPAHGRGEQAESRGDGTIRTRAGLGKGRHQMGFGRLLLRRRAGWFRDRRFWQIRLDIRLHVPVCPAPRSTPQMGQTHVRAPPPLRPPRLPRVPVREAPLRKGPPLGCHAGDVRGATECSRGGNIIQCRREPRGDNRRQARRQCIAPVRLDQAGQDTCRGYEQGRDSIGFHIRLEPVNLAV